MSIISKFHRSKKAVLAMRNCLASKRFEALKLNHTDKIKELTNAIEQLNQTVKQLDYKLAKMQCSGQVA